MPNKKKLSNDRRFESGCYKGLTEKRENAMELSIEEITRIYNIGYNCGHSDTVEGQEMPAHYTDMDEHHRDVVEEILEDMKAL
ncbi:MAG: hypothetical protein Unbinned3818contig1000_21 [Prokaryotic dsDNA virus sp.]|nr:hypothetical protein [Phycisphaerae bacterium]QDP45950.1 MAG: hypothetical protein Unbinned3818contig1000_21 [Prokaryotic dsDNA virus sp.]|tara:strand:+ start:246 stop:494 length:249 start_codon:yes stop_codon:yes gene_type:complete